jgi:hypothetical protein
MMDFQFIFQERCAGGNGGPDQKNSKALFSKFVRMRSHS